MPDAPASTTQTPIAWLNDHLDYEIKMLNGTFGLFFTIPDLATKAECSDEQRKILYDSNQESFCMHVRQLEEFFRKQGANSARDLSGKKYTTPDDPKFPDGKKFTEKLNRQIAHLVYGRPANDSEKLKDKDFEHMFRWVGRELVRFKYCFDDSDLKVRDVNLGLIPLEQAEAGKAAE